MGSSRSNWPYSRKHKTWKISDKCKNKLGADVVSNNHFVTAYFKLKVMAVSHKFERRNKTFDVQKLQDKTEQEIFKVNLRDHIQEFSQSL